MKIVRRKSDNVVFYLLDGHVVLDERGLHTPEFKAYDMKPQTHEIVEGVELPDRFVGGAMAWDDAWTITNQDAYDDAVKAEKEEARAGMVVTRVQFTRALVASDQSPITALEAEAWIGGAALPAIVSGAIAASGLSEAEKLDARLNALGAINIRRRNPLVLMLQAAVRMSDDDADALFQVAAQID